MAELLNFKYQGCLIYYIIPLKIDSFSVKAAKIYGSPPSQKVSMQIKFSAISFPNNSNILEKIYFWFIDSLASDDLPIINAISLITIIVIIYINQQNKLHWADLSNV